MERVLQFAEWRRYDDTGPGDTRGVNEDHSSVLAVLGAGEGFIGDAFVRLYRPREIESLNQAYEVKKYLPNLLIVASNGCGEGYAYDLEAVPRVVKVPFVPFDNEYVEVAGPSLADLLLSFASCLPAYAPNPETLEKEVDQLHPICLGGSPTDPANRATLTREKHVELVVFWNKTFRIVKRKTLEGGA